MSIAICRVQKLKGASAVAGMQIHDRREKEHSNSNPDIDRSHSSKNYAFIETPGKSFNALADERIKQGYTGEKAIRKDAIRVVEGLFTSDGVFFENKTPQEQRRFFEDCLKWTQDRFGADNIISAIVHMDEETPHLHVDFVPLTVDGRLSAKDMLGGRADLQRLQDDFYKSVGKPWGMERGERADLDNPEAEKPRRHKTTAEFKRDTTAEIVALEAKRKKLVSEHAKYAQICKETEERIKSLSENESALNRKIEGLKDDFKEKVNDYNRKIAEMNSKNREIVDEINGLKDESASLGAEVAAKKKILSDFSLKVQLASDLEDTIKEAYKQIIFIANDNPIKFAARRDDVREEAENLKKAAVSAVKQLSKAENYAISLYDEYRKIDKKLAVAQKEAAKVPDLTAQNKDLAVKFGKISRVIDFSPELQAHFKQAEEAMIKQIEAERQLNQQNNNRSSGRGAR